MAYAIAYAGIAARQEQPCSLASSAKAALRVYERTNRQISIGRAQLTASQLKLQEQQGIIIESHRELDSLRARLSSIALLRVEVLNKVKAAIESVLGGANAAGAALVRIGDNGNIVINEGVVFEYNSYAIKPEGTPLLQTLATALESVLGDPEVREYVDAIVVQGHTDDRGSATFNRELSAKRANAVLDYMFTANSNLEQTRAAWRLRYGSRRSEARLALGRNFAWRDNLRNRFQVAVDSLEARMLAARSMRKGCPLLGGYRHLATASRGAAVCLAVACGDSGGAADASGRFGSEATERAVQAAGTTPEQLVEVLLSAEGAAPTSGTANLLSERLGITEQEVRQKLALAISRFFGIGTGEPNQLVTEQGYRLYFELPQDKTQAFIWAPDSDDIRSEGMSYGMMIAVQAGLREHFDRLWKFARTHLEHPPEEPAGPWNHYFKWRGTVDGSMAESWGVTYEPDTVPAPDGEEYFAAALYLAHRRWGSDGDVNYREAADTLSQAMLDNPARDGRFPVIHRERDMVVFVPFEEFNEFSDPSYHLPAFYELFALDGAPSGAERWRAIAETSRQFLVDSAHPETGLHPDYANFDGTPNAGGERHDEFRYDAWRVVMNMALDYSWFSEDARMKAQVEKYHAFFSDHLSEGNVQNSLFALDGSTPEGGGSTALTATLAAGVLASESEQGATYLQNVWNVGQQSGLFRYYQQCVYLLGLLGAAGQYGYEWGPPAGAR